MAALRDYCADILVNLLPTGSIEATEHYAQAALEAGCAYHSAACTTPMVNASQIAPVM
jgi:myo-inositol-1-phosphate synthase